MTQAVVERIKVIDADTHIGEPDDLWTSRVSRKWGNLVPHVRVRPEDGEEYWYTGDDLFEGHPRCAVLIAGWKEAMPSRPKGLGEADPACWDPAERLRRIDEYGLWAQVIYPNVGGFGSGKFLKLEDPELMLECVRAYNDFLSDWCATDPQRLIPIAALPFWDVEACVKEIHRCARTGHKGLLFGNQPETYGMPHMAAPHWNPIWETAQDLGLSINFHIIAGNNTRKLPPFAGNGVRANMVKTIVMEALDNASAISELIVSGMCHRYPRLNYVSVESGVGFIPMLLEGLDWQWKNGGAMKEHPDYDLLPSEYFRRQIYGCWWFERESAKTALQLLPDNLMYETDFPHPTSMSPGPSMPYAENPRDFIESSLTWLPDETLRKVLHDNAARVYHMD